MITGCAEQLAVTPPSLPAQDHAQGPLPETGEGVPVLQRLVVGALVNFVPFDPPQLPLVTGGGATEAAFRWMPVIA
jgi:hypothetical protein